MEKCKLGHGKGEQCGFSLSGSWFSAFSNIFYFEMSHDFSSEMIKIMWVTLEEQDKSFGSAKHIVYLFSSGECIL